jgi:hypothetical protein
MDDLIKKARAITERDWLCCADPDLLILHLGSRHPISERKLRLFTVACCRRIWHAITDRRSRQAVEVAERFADGEATEKELRAAEDAAAVASRKIVARFPVYAEHELDISASLAAANSAEPPNCVFSPLRWELFYPAENAANAVADRSAECAAQADLLRDLFGNPFHPVALDPAWPTWNGGAVLHLARTIYDERRFEDLPVLADALEEAGCTRVDILSHCRQASVHVRGCWVLDLLLDKG